MITKVINVSTNKFIFNDPQLAINVRNKFRQHLIKYDANGNKKFEEDQIRQLLKDLLKQDQHQLYYAIKNVFRYDRNNDGWVTYQQFINFSVEQHFGQMAIQRLHKQGYYSRGSNRIMNLQQFTKTLDFCLQTIQITGTIPQYQQLFRQVDLDKDGWITYQDYFYFLRQYFGSLSIAANMTQNQPEFKDGNKQSPQERIAKLVYSQLKISVMKYDINKNLCLSKQEGQNIIETLFNIIGKDKTQISSRIMKSQSQISYQSFMKQIVVLYLSQYDIRKNYPKLSRIQFGSFPVMFSKSLSFVFIKPAEHVLKAMFEKYDNDQDGYISLIQYKQIIHSIFAQYRFDTRGLPFSKSNNYNSIQKF